MKDLDLVHVMPVAEFQDIVIAGNRFSELQNRTLSLEELCMHPLVSMESGTTTRLFGTISLRNRGWICARASKFLPTT